MPIPSTPSIMPNVLGYAADTVQIPETTPTGQGIPSFRDLFPFITQVDPDAGGVMVERAWMNALFNLLGQHAFFQQSGCVYPWQATLNYIAGSHVKGSDDVEYIALQPSGPDVSGTGAKDPSLEVNRNYWISLPSFVSKGVVPDTRKVIAGSGLTGGGTLSEDVTLAVLTDKVTAAVKKGAITVKDVAIGGDKTDLASDRGQIGDISPIHIADFNTFLESGVYRAKWGDDNNPGLNTPPGTAVNGIVYVASCKNAVGKITECRQIVYRLGTPGSNDWNIFTREMMSGGTWSPWRWILTDASLGDGLRFSGGKLSVPVATATTVGLTHGDGATLVTDAGVDTVKDVAIGGDLGDLASKRGQIGNSKAQGSHDFSSGMLSEKPGMYTATNSGSTNVPFTGPFAEMILGSPTHRGSLLITSGRPNHPRAAISAIYTEQGFSGYTRLITEQQIGDGLTVNNGIISVPEYEGATASAAGTSGLVPPATAGQQESFLTGGGEYKPALSTSGGTITGELNIAAPAGSSEGGEITLINGTDGKYPAKIDTTRNLIRFFGGPSNPVSVDLETGRFVGNLTGKADTAGIADNSLAFANGRRWVEVTYEGNPGWLIGSVKEELRPVNPSSLNVNYANSAGTANINLHDIRYYGSQDSITLPAGGTWLVWWVRNTTQVNGGMGTYAGGATVTPGQTNNYYCIRIA